MVQVRNAEEHGRQQEQRLTATRQSCDQLEQQVQDQNQQLQVQQKRAAKVSPSSSITCQTAYKHHITCAAQLTSRWISQLIVWLMILLEECLLA